MELPDREGPVGLGHESVRGNHKALEVKGFPLFSRCQDTAWLLVSSRKGITPIATNS